MRVRLNAFALATLPLAATLACSTPEALGGSGASCALATDCAEGFVCITQANNTRACCGVDSGTGCSNALASIQSVEEAGAPPDTGTQGSGPASDAMSSMADARSSSSRDAAAGGMTDAAVTDSGGPEEATAPPADAAGEAAAPPDDGGTASGSPDAAGEGDASSD